MSSSFKSRLQASMSPAARSSLVVAMIVGALVLSGCAGKPKLTETGFLSDYSLLKKVNDDKMNYSSPKLAEYDAFIIDPVEMRMSPKTMSAEERATVANHFRAALTKMIESEQLTVTETAGVGVARIRVALTDVVKSTWWQKLHPVSRSLGGGTGGAAMEGEIIDSVTGAQLAAVVQAGVGNQFDLTAFSTVADVTSAIDQWVAAATARLKELRASAKGSR